MAQTLYRRPLPADTIAFASPDGRLGSISLHQDVLVHAARLSAGQRVSYALPDRRLAYLHVAHGTLELNGQALAAGDGARIHDEATLDIVGRSDCELLLFELPTPRH